jgi:hypothetical protein
VAGCEEVGRTPLPLPLPPPLPNNFWLGNRGADFLRWCSF